MKKTVLIFALCGMACGLVSAQKLTVKNIFGADRDIFDDYDLLNQNREKEIDNSLLGQYYASKTGNVLEDTDVSRVFSIGDRIQADYKSSMLNGRLRLDMLYKAMTAKVLSSLWLRRALCIMRRFLTLDLRSEIIFINILQFLLRILRRRTIRQSTDGCLRIRLALRITALTGILVFIRQAFWAELQAIGHGAKRVSIT